MPRIGMGGSRAPMCGPMPTESRAWCRHVPLRAGLGCHNLGRSGREEAPKSGQNPHIGGGSGPTMASLRQTTPDNGDCRDCHAQGREVTQMSRIAAAAQSSETTKPFRCHVLSRLARRVHKALPQPGWARRPWKLTER
jgi:hypothetical protein